MSIAGTVVAVAVVKVVVVIVVGQIYIIYPYHITVNQHSDLNNLLTKPNQIKQSRCDCSADF